MASLLRFYRELFSISGFIQTSGEIPLYNLKALGFNTVETYIPWALHEPQEGQFQAEGMLDFEAYFKLVEEMGLYLIVRPTPYICAEFDFGGLPAWLLRYPSMRLRVNHPLFSGEGQSFL